MSTQSITYAIKQDSLGNVWVASEEGVLKHNSKYYKIYNTYNGLPESVSNRTTAVFIDTKQRVWIGLEKGICLYNAELDRFDLVGSKTEINPSLIHVITEDTFGNIWIGGFNGLWKYNSEHILTRVVPNHSIQAVYNYKDQLIFGTSKGLFVYNPTTNAIDEIKLDSGSKSISYIGLVNDMLLAGCKSGKIFKIDTNLKQTEQITFEKKLSNPITDIIANATKNIYIATDGDGLYYLDKAFSIRKHFKENVDNTNSISSNGIYDLEIGNENILWIATYGGGVNFFDSNRLPFRRIQHQINTPNSIVSNFTRAIAEDKNGNLWFGTKQGISIWNVYKNSWKHIGKLAKSGPKRKDIVLALEPDNNYMWVGTYNNGLYKVSIDNFKSTHYNAIFPKKKILKKIYTIYKDSKNNIWFGGIEGGLTTIRPDNSIDTYPIYQIKSISESNAGHILAAGKNGIYKIDDTKTEFKLIEKLNPNENTLAYSTINAVCQTKDGRLILATNGAGLIFYNPKNESIKKLTVNSGMPSDIIQGVVMHSDTDFWASTTKGLAHIFIKSNAITINVFDKRDGLASSEYNYGSYEKLNDSLVAFGGVDGVTLFNPEHIKGQDFKPILVFDEFKLFNKAVKPGSKILQKHINLSNEIELENYENSVEIQFSGILQGSSSKIKYSWKLDGFDEQWSTPSYTNFATYTNLNSGDYIFRVKASNKYGNFGKERFIKITILSPWWATNKAFIGYALLILGAILLIIYFTSIVVNKKNADEQIHFFNNITHEIKTPLTILMSSLDNVTENVNSTNDESKKRIKTTIKRINSLFEQMLTFHKVTAQNFAAQDISEIKLEEHINHILYDFKPLTKERNLKMIVSNYWSDEFFYNDIGIFDKIMLNLISNAIKYSFDDGKIMLNLSKTSRGQLKIEISDQGLGIPQDQQKYILKRYYRARNAINSQRPGTGLGLVMVKKLIEASGGSIHFNSKENIGTTFTILLKNLHTEYKQNEDTRNDSVQQFTETYEDQLELDEFSDSKVLIVEDNDELRAILVKTLGVYFQIFEANNGQKGLEIASQIFPDIILTDLIMPEMDGMEMSAKIKDDINLNHIPIFMLSVLQNSVQKLESIESGISEYIEKPVDIKFLLAKMVNRLKWQKKIRKKYLHEHDSDNASIFRNKNDQDFLKKLELTIIDNLENNTFSVHDLSDSLGMSRTSLYMKLKNLVDLSPQDFIIHTKLKRAKKLLIEGEHSIKEVAYSSGFSNPKYFSTSFKKFYNTTPTSFLESLKKDIES